MRNVRIALLDMNNNQVNQGFKNIKEISEAFKQQSEENIKEKAEFDRKKWQSGFVRPAYQNTGAKKKG